MKLEAAERCHKVELRYELVQLYVDAQHREEVGRLQRRHPIGLLHHDLKNKIGLITLLHIMNLICENPFYQL